MKETEYKQELVEFLDAMHDFMDYSEKRLQKPGGNMALKFGTIAGVIASLYTNISEGTGNEHIKSILSSASEVIREETRKIAGQL
jgi:hypothetical protein